MDVVEFLLEQRAACCSANVQHVRIFHTARLHSSLKAWQDINAKDRNWQTPVSLACQKGRLKAELLASHRGQDLVCCLEEVVEFLADFDADLTSCDEGRATPYDWSVCGLSYIGDKYEKLVCSVVMSFPSVFRLLERPCASVLAELLSSSETREYEKICDTLQRRGAKVPPP